MEARKGGKMNLPHFHAVGFSAAVIQMEKSCFHIEDEAVGCLPSRSVAVIGKSSRCQ